MSKISRPAGPTWKALVREVVQGLPRAFSLKDVLGRRDKFAAHYPDNRFIDAKIRQSLQLLRDQGVIRFLGNGRYERLDATPVFSPLIDDSVAATYTSKAQIARVVVETWAEMNLYCVHCSADALSRLPENTPVADFTCHQCTATYQIKSKDGRFGQSLTGAAYAPTLSASHSGTMPEYVLVEYDRRFSTVVFVDALPGRAITSERIEPRKRLAETARRAGWQGCTIHIAGIDRVPVVRPAGLPRDAVRENWADTMAALS